ncbi:XRE family transcriptional regulator [Salinarimonas chemoclinalis]|uniref:XRE family transcriptional regulator n=1 Tax=Salinarimonas chemoclinalis TaxID=3241599 RepID=UPI003558D113
MARSTKPRETARRTKSGERAGSGEWRVIGPRGRALLVGPETTIGEVADRLREMKSEGAPARTIAFRVAPAAAERPGERASSSLRARAEVAAAEGGPAPSRTIQEALARARERGSAFAARTLDQEDMLGGDALARRLAVSRETVNVWRQRRRLLALEGAKRGYRYPAWQIGANGKPWPALPRLFAILGDDPWTVHRFLVQPHGALGGLTGRDALTTGRDAEALRAAESMAAGDFA